METLSTVNFVIAAIVLFVVIWAIITPTLLSSEHDKRRFKCLGVPSVRLTFGLWGLWWLSILVTYLVIDTSRYGWTLACSDFGDLCTLGAAIQYCAGTGGGSPDGDGDPTFTPSTKKVGIALIGIFGLMVVWDIAMPALFHSPQGRIVVVTPSIAISSISLMALGWSVVVRCGWGASPFLLLAALYTLAVLPAYFDKVVLAGADQILRDYFNKLYLAFGVVAAGKIVYAVYFLGYFLSPNHNCEWLREAQYWPRGDRRVTMDRRYARFFRWVGVTLVVGFLGLLGNAFASVFRDWVKQLFGI